MKDVDMIEAFAELEGIKLTDHRGHWLHKNDQGGMFINGVTMKWYNPITDLALNCAARDKYEVEVYYDGKSISVQSNNKFNGADVTFSSIEDIPKTVIECILKSKGLWK